MKISCFLVTLLLATCQVNGQAWSKKKGEGYFKLGYNGIVADSYFSPDGSAIPIRTTGIHSASLYGELGLSDRLTIIGNVPFVASNTLNTIRFRQSGREIPSDRFTSVGDIDVALKYGWRQDKLFLLATTVLLGLPTGGTGGGTSQILQTGDGEFNQMLRVDGSVSLHPRPIFMSAYLAFNNRTRDFSDEVRFGIDVGYTKEKYLIAFHLASIKSLENGEAENASNGIFANNMEYLLPTLEFAYYLPYGLGISVYGNYAFSGRNVLQAPGYGMGIFYRLTKQQ